ncbi:hypothetical protein D3C81_1799180 [compost metagenome]
MSSNGPTRLTTWPRLSAIMVITRNSDRVSDDISSIAPSLSRIPISGRALRIATPSIRHQRKPGRVTAPSPNQPASSCPPTRALRVAASTTRKLPASTDAWASPLSWSATPCSPLPTRWWRLISHCASGPPMMPPSTRPMVAAVIDNSMIDCRLCTSAKRSA